MIRTMAALFGGVPANRGGLLTAAAGGTQGGTNLMRFGTTTIQRQSPYVEKVLYRREGSHGIVLCSTFTAPEPPHSKGLHVFQDIDFSVAEGPSSPSSLRKSDPNAVFVVNGASRGIGLQLAKALLSSSAGKVVACCRSPGTAMGLQELLASVDHDTRARISLISIDLEDQTSVEQAGSEIRRIFDRVDLLWNVAGILGDTTPGPERSVVKIDRDWMQKTFQVNVIGPVMLSKELIPLMSQRRRAPTKSAIDGAMKPPTNRPNSIIANLSARVGSISDNSLGGWYSYRMSKAALNQATRTLANELNRQSVWCVALHPGTTDTDLSKPFQKNVQEGRLFPVEFTVESLMKVVDSIQEENSGGLYDWAGKAIPF